MKKMKDVMVIKSKNWPSTMMNDASAVLNTAVLVLILLASVISIASGAYNPFIYFRF